MTNILLERQKERVYMGDWFHFFLSDVHDWIVKKAQLVPLGITDHHLHFLMGFVAIALIYFLIRPIVYWMILLKWERLLTFIVSGVSVLFLLVIYEMYQGITGTGNMEFSDVASGSLALVVYGGVIAILFLMELLLSYIKSFKGKKASNV